MSNFERLDEEGSIEESRFDRTRSDYSGVELDDEFQPLDEVELAEEGLLLDDPEHPGKSAASLDPDEVGWDLDE
jgi:hypothetical protein